MIIIISSLTFILFKKEPEKPPSIASVNKHDYNSKHLHIYYEDFKILLTNIEFVKLLIGFGLGLGLFNGLSTLIEQYVKPANYSSDDAGIFGGAIIGGGLIGAGIGGYILDTTQVYKSVLKAYSFLSLVFSIFLLLAMAPDQFGILFTAFTLLGFSVVPLLPICFETAVEFGFIYFTAIILEVLFI